MRAVPARWGDPARGIPTLLDPQYCGRATTVVSKIITAEFFFPN